MGNLDNELERLIASARDGGFGDPDALDQHRREVDHVKFKITQRNNLRLGLLSALIGAVVGFVCTSISHLFL